MQSNLDLNLESSTFNNQVGDIHSLFRLRSMRSITAAALFRKNRCRLQYLLIQNYLAKIWSAGSPVPRSNFGSNYCSKLLGSNPFSTSRDGIESGRKVDPGNIDTNERSKSYSTCRPPDGLLARIVSAANVLNISKSAQCNVESSKYLDETVESRVDDFHKFVTILVFDIETTRLSTKDAKIVEFAVQDLQGGENSTFETLVNPEQPVQNTQFHNITTNMVNSPEVPKFKDVIPILRDYVRTRQEISNSPVLLVAHNGWRFDVPLLINEFKRCSEEIPSDWLFLDTMELARELANLLKLQGSKLSSKSLEYLREYYGIPLVGQAHRAMPDVYSLSKVLRAMTKDLKLPLSSLLEKSFKASDLSSEHKKATKAKKIKKISLG